MCCALAGLMLAMVAVWRRLLTVASGWCRMLRWAAVFAAALVLGVGAAAAEQHFGHYAERADANRRTVLAEVLAQPICAGTPASRSKDQLLSQLD